MADRIRPSPDFIAHQLVTNVGSPARISLRGNIATIPIEPYHGPGSPRTEQVPAASFKAVIEEATIVDGGLNLLGVDGLHLPESEWKRIGLQRHWDAADVDTADLSHPPERKLEVWCSREANCREGELLGDHEFEHLSHVPDDSPVITEWQEHASEHEPDKPPLPFTDPVLTVETLCVEGAEVGETHGLDRVEVGTIQAIEILDTIEDWPTEPGSESGNPG